MENLLNRTNHEINTINQHDSREGTLIVVFYGDDDKGEVAVSTNYNDNKDYQKDISAIIAFAKHFDITAFFFKINLTQNTLKPYASFDIFRSERYSNSWKDLNTFINAKFHSIINGEDKKFNEEWRVAFSGGENAGEDKKFNELEIKNTRSAE